MCGKNLRGGGKAGTKVLRREHGWCVCRIVRRPVWLEQSVEGREQKTRSEL